MIQNSKPTWDQLLELAQNNTSARRVRRPGQSPSTAPIPSSLHKLPPEASPPVLLYRDTNSWCPFCERVWFALEEKEIPFVTEFIDLNNKPKWYTDLVPSTQVPAAKVEDQLVYESKDILLALEARFSDSPLLPAEPEENAIADILKNSGAQALARDGDISAVKDAIKAHLKLLTEYLLHGDKTQLPWGRVGARENLDPFSAAVGAIALAYVRNRICAPRDMSAGAAIAFRAAADKVLASIY